MRSGFIYLPYGYLLQAGLRSYDYASSGASRYAFHMVFDASGVVPSNGPYDRHYGFSLRCLQE